MSEPSPWTWRSPHSVIGPWTAHEQGDADHYAILDKPNHWLIALHLNGEMTLTKQREIVKLIAAAPDTLEALKDTTAHLVAAVSLLERSSKKAAPSDKVFDLMVADYKASIVQGRNILTAMVVA